MERDGDVAKLGREVEGMGDEKAAVGSGSGGNCMSQFLFSLFATSLPAFLEYAPAKLLCNSLEIYCGVGGL